MFVIGHRGAAAIEPENTLRALRAGMRCAHFVEVDVRTTRDGVPVIMHDATIDRTTSGQGKVAEFTLAELKQFDAGKESIPTLEEVLRLVEGKCGLAVELKEERDPAPILELITHSSVEPLLVVSFHAPMLKEVKRTLRQARTGLIFSHLNPDPLETAMVIHADLLLPRFSLLSPTLVEDAHFRNLLVVTWTLNSAEEIQKAVEARVDGFATDDPCRAKKVLHNLAAAWY
ncbi:MAG: glycerophosphodiester phosphodiesterase [Methanomicrobiales archaeon]|nr:glycerophosphodiester phosphodiesterase [Methanomicrobiales archaeon]